MKTFNTTEVWEKIETYPYAYIRLKDTQNKQIVPFNSRGQTKEDRIDQIKKFLSGAEGSYIIEIATNNRGTNAHEFYITTGENNLSDPAPVIIEHREKTKLITDTDLLELRVENERLKLENERLRLEIEELTEQLEEEEIQPLADGPGLSAGNNWKDILIPLADQLFNKWGESMEIKRAELGYKSLLIQQQQQQQQQAPPMYNTPEKQESEKITLEELEAVKRSSPSDFYSWLAIPSNRDYYESLTQ